MPRAVTAAAERPRHHASAAPSGPAALRWRGGLRFAPAPSPAAGCAVVMPSPLRGVLTCSENPRWRILTFCRKSICENPLIAGRLMRLLIAVWGFGVHLLGGGAGCHGIDSLLVGASRNVSRAATKSRPRENLPRVRWRPVS